MNKKMEGEIFYCKFQKNKNIVVIGVTKKKKILHKRFKNICLNLTINDFENYLEKKVEKETTREINKIFFKSFVKNLDVCLNINLYLIVIKKNKNLIPMCIESVVFILSKLKFKLNVVSYKNLHYNTKFQNIFLKTFSYNCVCFWSFYFNWFVFTRNFCNIKIFGLISMKFFTNFMTCALNFKLLTNTFTICYHFLLKK